MPRPRPIPEAVRRRVEYFDGQTCAECGRTIDGKALKQHLDHREAFSEGGEHAVFNLDPLCHECNQAKGAESTERTERLRERHEERRAHLQTYPTLIHRFEATSVVDPPAPNMYPHTAAPT